MNPGFLSRRGRWGAAALGGVVLVAVLWFAANAVIGAAIADRMRSSVARRLTGPVNVSLGGDPAVIDALTNRIGSVSIDAPSTQLCAVSGAHVHIGLTGVRRDGGNAHVDAFHGTVSIPATALTARLGGGQLQPTVTPNPAANALDVAVGPGGVVQFAMTPRLAGNRLTLSPSSVTLLGRPAPPQIAQAIDSRASASRPLPALHGVRPTQVAVTGGGLSVRLDSSAPFTIDRSRQPGAVCG